MSNKAKPFLIVDTNVISHALIDSQVSCYVELFKNLEKQYKFGVTEFTRYELMRSSDSVHRDKIEKYIKENMYTIDLSENLMKFSARVSYFYSKSPSTKNRTISDGDIINGAFSIAKNCALLTIDNTDYPREFFTEVSRHRMKYTSKRSSKETIDIVYLLKPDVDQIKLRATELNI